jgi:AraC-like DNA-binding protein
MRLTADIAHDSLLGRWRLVTAAPHPALAPFIAGYQGYDEAGPSGVVRRETPQPVYPLVLSFRGRFRLREAAPGTAWRRLPAAFAAGLYEQSVLVAAEGAAECLQVDLTPLGARRLFRLDLAALGHGTHDLSDLLGAAGRRLVERLAATRGWPPRIALAEAFLAARIAATPGNARAEAAWTRLAASRGRLPIARLGAELELSRQGLAGLFAREIGLAPKAAARVLRLDAALALMARAPTLPLAEVALAAGYADQAHFGREARAMTGETPVALRRHRLADGTGLVADP